MISNVGNRRSLRDWRRFRAGPEAGGRSLYDRARRRTSMPYCRLRPKTFFEKYKNMMQSVKNTPAHD